MTASIVSLSASEIERVREQLREVYLAAFGMAPYFKSQTEAYGFALALDRHAERAGFRLLAARDSDDGRIVGFAYGYDSVPGQWWHDTVRQALPPLLAAVWMADAFELAELAVHPAQQGHGFGARLHDELLAGVERQSALLSTAHAETVALGLYRRRGWRTLADYFYFPGVPEPYRILGLDVAGFKRQR